MGAVAHENRCDFPRAFDQLEHDHPDLEVVMLWDLIGGVCLVRLL